MSKLTPMMQQYMDIKNEHQDAILFFRCGDFYEMFFTDAEVASRELEITLTARDAQRVPMCGVPFHAGDVYIGRLIEKGYKVAICEQVEDPQLAKGIVKREVIRIITPGTVLDANLLDDKQNNYLVAIATDETGYGLAVVDISTGQFMVTELTSHRGQQKLFDELSRLQPAECILEQELFENEDIKTGINRSCRAFISSYNENSFGFKAAHKALLSHFCTLSLDGFGCQGLTIGISAAGAVIDFLKASQKTSLEHINKLMVYSTGDFMFLDSATRRNLEITKTIRDGNRRGSLLWILDNTVTAMGGRLLKSWLEQPLIDIAKIQERLDATEELTKNLFLREDIKKNLAEVYDLERLIGRVSYGAANGKDLIALKNSLRVLPKVKDLLKQAKSTLLKELHEIIDLLTDVTTLIEEAVENDPPFSVREGGIIKSGYHVEVDRLRSATKEGKHWIASLEAKEREKSGIKSLKVGFNKVFGYYIEVTKANMEMVPAYFIRKQTLANAERYITPELKEYESTILGAEERITQLEYELFVQVREQVAKHTKRIQNTAGIIAQLDVLISFAEAAVKNGYVKPVITSSDNIVIRDGRHPVVEKVLQRDLFVPNDTLLDNQENNLIIITGPNMAGKSTYMRQVALITLLAQTGCFVPATEAEIGIVDRIFTRVGASDDLATGQSTFMVEMNEVANILNNATEKSLIILDEIGRGTSTFDGLSIAWAVAEYIHNKEKIGAKALFATHYHELTELAEIYTGVQNYSIAVKEKGDDIIFLRKIITGGADRSYGIQVARLAGLPLEVVNRAKEILVTLEKQEDVGKGEREVAVATDLDDELKARQLSFFPDLDMGDPILKELKNLNLLEMTPLEAMNKLFEFNKRLNTGKG